MEIQLTNSGVTLIDDADAEIVCQHKWRWRRSGDGYRSVVKATVQSKAIALSRFLMNPPSHLVVDHINGDTFDNRRSNLRVCTNSQNLLWRGPLSGKYKGVCWNKGAKKWQAVIKKHDKSYYLGLFADPVDAARAYDAKAKELHGEWAWLNIKEVA